MTRSNTEHLRAAHSHRSRSTQRSSLVTIATVLSLSLIGASACGLNTADSFEEIPTQDIPFGLEHSATTTTGPPPTTADAESTDPVDPTDETDPSQTTSTLAIPAIEAAEIYQVVGLNRLQRQSVPLSAPLGVFQVVAVLEEPPSGDLAVGLRTAVRPGLVADISVDRGVAFIDLNGAQLNRMSPRDQRLAIAQLVLSITSSIRGVGQVAFSVDGEPAEIGIPPQFTLSDPGQPLAYADFAPLLLGSSLVNGNDDTTEDESDEQSDEVSDEESNATTEPDGSQGSS